MRTQLAVPDNTLRDAGHLHQLFTMHGSVMMFLFAIPVVEAVAVYLLPRCSRHATCPPRLFRVRVLGLCSGRPAVLRHDFLRRVAGWRLVHVPAAQQFEYSPDIGADFWLLGIGFIEISAIAGAIELVVGILRTRPPACRSADADLRLDHAGRGHDDRLRFPP